ncbi:MAG: DMT family transporter [Sterolibacterium sp.]|nr:DMT family transporter [Sterolibacterium sp.]
MAANKDRILAPMALLVGAATWGLIWYPYRLFDQVGLSGLPATTLTYLVAFLLGAVVLRKRLAGFWQVSRGSAGAARFDWRLPLIGLTAGACNLGYVLATLHGEVMRVVLLFYLAPLWTVFWAYWLLGERLNRAGRLVIALSLSGAFVMLWHPELGLPWPVSGAEWLGLLAGFLFALSNVLIRQAADLTVEAKSMAVFIAAVLLGILLLPVENLLLGGDGDLLAAYARPFHGQMQAWHWGMLLLVGLVLLLVHLIVQYGLTHVAANRAIVIFIFELVVAALSSWLLVDETMGLREWLGGAMIITASLFSGQMAADAPESRETDGAANDEAARRPSPPCA